MKAGGVENAGHADDSLAGEAGFFEGGLGHGVKGVGDDDENGVGRGGDGFTDDVGHDVEVGVEEVVTAHAGLAGDACGDDDDVGVRGVGVVVGADDGDVALFDGHGLKEVEGFALGHTFDDVDEDYVGELFGGDPVGCGCTDVAGTYDGYFLAHVDLVSLMSLLLFRSDSAMCRTK